jgi:hypothetical protein
MLLAELHERHLRAGRLLAGWQTLQFEQPMLRHAVQHGPLRHLLIQWRGMLG